MRKFSIMLAVAGLMAAFAGDSTAQDQPKRGRGEFQPGGGRGMMGGFGSIYGYLSNNKDLQAELKVTDEQKKKFEEIAKAQQGKMRELFTGGGFGRDATDEQRKEMREKMDKFAAETKKAYEEALTPAQAKRITQIGYQQQGIRAFSNKEVQTALKMTDDQKEKIKGVMETYMKDAQELRGGRDRGQRPSEENQKKLEALRKDAEEKVVAALTDEQRKSWKDMTGEKFDVSKLTFMPARPRDN